MNMSIELDLILRTAWNYYPYYPFSVWRKTKPNGSHNKVRSETPINRNQIAWKVQ